MNLKKAFTLAEAILTMTILGVIAAVMISTLKPSQYKQQGYDTLKKKVYADLDSITETFIVECAQDMDLTKIFGNCTRTNETHTFGATEASLYGEYMRGTVGEASSANGKCAALSSYSSIRLKNGVCVYFGDNSIKVDVNGNEKPDAVGTDRMVLTVDSNGISTDIDDAIGNTGTW